MCRCTNVLCRRVSQPKRLLWPKQNISVWNIILLQGTKHSFNQQDVEKCNLSLPLPCSLSRTHIRTFLPSPFSFHMYWGVLGVISHHDRAQFGQKTQQGALGCSSPPPPNGKRCRRFFHYKVQLPFVLMRCVPPPLQSKLDQLFKERKQLLYGFVPQCGKIPDISLCLEFFSGWNRALPTGVSHVRY